MTWPNFGGLLVGRPVTRAVQGQRNDGARALDLPSVQSADSFADASVGTDDADAHRAAGRRDARRMTIAQVLEVLDLGVPSAMEIELRSKYGTCTLDVQRDLASLVCGRSAAALAIRLRWLGVVICSLGAAAPVFLVFAVHWATGGLGQFVLAYKWPFWLEVWMCVGYWLMVCMELLWYASMQSEIVWMAVKQLSTLWILAMTGVYVAGLGSLFEVGIHRSTWVGLPIYIALMLLFPMITLADALPPKLRLPILRFAAPSGLGTMCIIALVLRLPTAKGTPGELVWSVMGANPVTNLQALAYSATVMVALLLEGVLSAWAFPSELAFIQTSVRAEAPIASPSIALPQTAQRAVCPLWPFVTEDAPGTAATPCFCTGAAQSIEACRLELARLHDTTPEAERPDGHAAIQHRFRKLAHQYAKVQLD
jgi:hypothetical protein